MPRTRQTLPPFRGLEPQPDLGSIGMELRDVHHVARNSERENHAHTPLPFYGFLSAMDGPARGPWLLQFECTPAPWLEEFLSSLAEDGKLRELGHALAGHSFDEAWARGYLGNRVTIRSIRKLFNRRYRENPPCHGLFDVRVDAGEWTDRYGLSDPPRSGYWYWLGLEALPQHAGPRPLAAMLCAQKQGKMAFEDFGVHELVALEQLEAYFLNEQHKRIPQSILHALHCGDEE